MDVTCQPVRSHHPGLSCDYCRASAVDTIPTVPGRVCRHHAEAFWAGVLSEVQRRREGSHAARPLGQPQIVPDAA